MDYSKDWEETDYTPKKKHKPAWKEKNFRVGYTGIPNWGPWHTQRMTLENTIKTFERMKRTNLWKELWIENKIENNWEKYNMEEMK